MSTNRALAAAVLRQRSTEERRAAWRGALQRPADDKGEGAEAEKPSAPPSAIAGALVERAAFQEHEVPSPYPDVATKPTPVSVATFAPKIDHGQADERDGVELAKELNKSRRYF